MNGDMFGVLTVSVPERADGLSLSIEYILDEWPK
jgi:hypothetical protein